MKPSEDDQPTDPPPPASLWARVAAFGLDYLLIAAYLLVVVGAGLLLQVAAPRASEVIFGSPLLGELAGFLVLTLPVTLFFAISEQGVAGATWGKRRMGLRVVTADGHRIGIGRSLARSGLKFVPWELSHAVIWQFTAAGPNPPPILNLGLILVWALVGLNLLSALLDGRHRALYDRAAGTVVVRLGASQR